MECADVDRMLSEGRAEDAEVRTHVDSCDRCRAMVNFAGNPLPDFAVSTAAAERIRAAVRAELTPVRPLPGTRAWILGAVGLGGAWCGVHAVLFGTEGWAAMSAIQLTLLLGLALLVMAGAAVSLLDSVRPGSRQSFPPLAPAGLLMAGFALLAGLLFPAGMSPHFVREGVMCLVVGMIASAAVGGLAYLVARRGYSTDWRRTGMLLGVLGGAASMAGLSVECPRHEFTHLLVWHGLVILLSISAGFLGGRQSSKAGVV